ncbi:MAG: pyridoxal-dependent decarboxylase [Cyclobacteriaceae bacterium]
MIDKEEFKKRAYELVDWMADYMENVEEYPVKSTVAPGEIKAQLPQQPPATGESFDAIWNDFQKIIMPGMTHWQSPNFHAYFPANNSYPSIMAEMVMSTMGAQCMIWETSPAAAELEEHVLNWLGKEMGIPADWSGVIQDTASTATLAAILTARERATAFETNKSGFTGAQVFRVYCSSETHSSIEKGVKIAGIGSRNLVKIPVGEDMSMNTAELEAQIKHDLNQGYTPICVVSAVGTTGTVAVDDVRAISTICQAHGVWHHIDAAYAGTALLLPEYHHWIDGIADADSFVFNPHKWMFTNFDCTAYYVKSKEALIKTFEILPEYLKTSSRGVVNDYRDWGIPLGRRFRALKLWFVIRSFGMEGLREKLRHHISLADWLHEQVLAAPDFEVVTPKVINMVVFRYAPQNQSADQLDSLNEQLIQNLNATGKIFLSHTKANGKYALRMPIGQTNVEAHHIEASWELIKSTARQL